MSKLIDLFGKILEAEYIKGMQWGILTLSDNNWGLSLSIFQWWLKKAGETPILEDGTKRRIYEPIELFNKQDTRVKNRTIFLYWKPWTWKTLVVTDIINDRPEWITALIVTWRQLRDTSQIEAMFNYARKFAPCYLEFDDCEHVMKDRNVAQWWEYQMTSWMITELWSFSWNDWIVLIMTTNHINFIDEAITDRPERVNDFIEIPLPWKTEREDFIKKWLSDNEKGDMENKIIDLLTSETDWFTFDIVRWILSECLIFWFNIETINMQKERFNIGKRIKEIQWQQSDTDK